MVLRGYSGYNTRWVLKVLEKVFAATQHGDGGINGAPVAITIFFGANDACLPDRYGAFQHVPLLEYKQNLHSIVSFFVVSSSLCVYSQLVAATNYQMIRQKGSPITVFG